MHKIIIIALVLLILIDKFPEYKEYIIYSVIFAFTMRRCSTVVLNYFNINQFDNDPKPSNKKVTFTEPLSVDMESRPSNMDNLKTGVRAMYNNLEN